MLSTAGADEVLALFGPRDQNVRKLRKRFDVDITSRDGKIRVRGTSGDVGSTVEALEQMRASIRSRGSIGSEEMDRLTRPTDAGGAGPGKLDEGGDLKIGGAGRKIRPRTPGQAAYVDAIRRFDLTFAIGPAGCGKTYLAVATAVEALRNDQVKKIVLVRPAVEAGENLGFLPGDLRAKLNPYLRPLMDALGEMVDFDQARALMEKDIIEIIPLAYMRGRTLNSAFVILDEAQNTTVAQMKMFLTRMGEDSKMVVSGDHTQLDLPRGVRSGLHDAIDRLGNIDAIGRIRLRTEDIVRHRLVQRIVEAYDDDAPIRQPGPSRDGLPNDDHAPEPTA